MNKKGLLITLEGIDGSGKTLLAKNLLRELKARNIDAILTKQPGGTPLGEKLRTILHEEKKHVNDMAEYLLFAADRAQHITQIIKPALKANNIVISDRMADSSLAYQGYGRSLDIKKINVINSWAMQNIEPDIIFYIEIDIKTAQERIFNRSDALTSFEKEKTEFWQKVITGYNEIFKNRKNVIYLNGKDTPEKLTKICMDKILKIYEV
ncbi:MAG: dTMP kinase [bacterium]